MQNDNEKLNDALFSITISDVQEEAIEKLGRYLTEDELLIAKEGLENGLLFGIGTIYNTIFFEMLDESKSPKIDKTAAGKY